MTAEPRPSPSALRLWFSRRMRLIRRIHMYAGLIMFPWILLYGISGILFNHPNAGEEVSGIPVGGERLAALTGLAPWQPDTVAADVVSALNAASPGQGYALDRTTASRFSGAAVFKAPSDDGVHLLLLDLERAGGVLASRKARPAGAPAPFARISLSLPQHSLATLENRVSGLLTAHHLSAHSPLRAALKLAPKLEFRVRDAANVAWNATFDIGTGTLAGRRADQWPSIGMNQWLAMLHTTHHFPMKAQARWLWAFFQDLLGVVMVFWALSGLLMWWQMKATRLSGVLSVAAAVLVAGAVIYGTMREISFGHVAQALAPGD